MDVLTIWLGIAIGASSAVALLAVLAPMGTRDRDPRFVFWARVVIALAIALVAWGLWGFLLVEGAMRFWKGRDATILDDLGKLGDLFGGVNALFAAAAFAFVAVGAFYQHETWKLQETLTQLARKEHVRQGFEPLFFELLRRIPRLTELKSKTLFGEREMGFDQPVEVGIIADRLRDHLRKAGQVSVDEEGQDQLTLQKDAVIDLYTQFYFENQTILGTYYRALYHVFKLVWDSGMDPMAQVRYANIARSTLGTDELFLLALDGLVVNLHFRALIEQYGLLSYGFVNDEGVAVDRAVAQFYQESATFSYHGRRQYWKWRLEERADLDRRLRNLDMLGD